MIARSNSYYNTFVVEKGIFFENQSYWEARCIPENNKDSIIYGTPGAKWCLDGFGNFYADKPTRTEWFYIFYTKKPSDTLVLFFLWPVHFLGFDLIHFKSVAAVWQFG